MCTTKRWAGALALAAVDSPEWDRVLGRPRHSDLNQFVRTLADEAVIDRELRQIFDAEGLRLQIAAVEKVLVLPVRNLPFREKLPPAGLRPEDKLPFDCQLWFSVTVAKRR